MARGSIQKRKGERGTTYLVRVDLGPDPETGKRRQPSRTYRTRKEAEEGLTQWLAEIDRGIVIEPSRMTVSEYLDHWLRSYGEPNLLPSTYESYARLIKLHIRPAIGGVLLQKLQPAQVQSFYNQKLKSGRADKGKGGLSARTVRYIHTILREALDQAVKWQLVARNVADAVEPPRANRPQVKAWTREHVRAFLKAAEGDHYDPAWLVLLSTGLRRGELLGLRWQDVDLTNGTLTVRQGLVVVANKITFQPPKTRSGRRTVSLPPACVEALRAHRDRQLFQRQRLGLAWHDHDLVFCTGDGGPIHPRNFYRRFQQLGTRAKLPPISVHGLRHTNATLLLEEQVHPKVASERLGHSTIAITLDTYSHVMPVMQKEAAEKVGRVIAGI